MSKQELYQARKLIEAKQYQDAREILMKVDHPTAEKWLAKLDEIDPPFAVVETSREKKSMNGGAIALGVLILLGLFALLGNSYPIIIMFWLIVFARIAYKLFT